MSSTGQRPTIEIHDQQGGALAVGLVHVLAAIGPSAEELHWRLVQLWGAGALAGARTMRELERAAEAAPDGLPMPWEELQGLAEHATQIMDMQLLGFVEAPDPQSSGELLLEASELQIEAFDSTCWIVAGRDEGLIRRVAAQFRDVRWMSATD